MNQLVKEITKGLLEEQQKTVAVYGGGFKPPTKGHFEVVKQSLDENPEIDEYIIYVGKAERDGITLEDSLKVWDIYKNYLPSKVRIEKSIKPPIKSIYDYAKEHPQDEVLWIIGAREENEADFADIASRTKSITKYPNLELRTIVTKGNVSGTAARNAAKVSPEKLNDFLPDFLSSQEKNDIFAILSNNISEIGDLSQVPYKWSYLPYYSDELNKEYSFTTKDSKYNVIFYGNKEGDNWDLEFLASTGIGGSSTRTLTGGNEPFKIMSTVVDIVKDFLKKADTPIKTISYTPTKGKRGEEDAKDNTRAKLYKAIIQKQFPKAKISGEDDVTVDISAYSGNINEAIVGDKIVCDNCGWDWKIEDGGDDLYTCHKCWHDNTPKLSLNEHASYTDSIDIVEKISELTQHMIDKGMNIEPLPTMEFIDGDSENAKDFFGKTAYYDPEAKHIVLYTEGRHPKDIVRSYAHEMIHHIQNLEGRLGNITTTNTTEDDHLTKLEQEANLKGTMTFRGWTDSINEGPQFGVLYHFTQELPTVISQNTLRGPVSLTRSLDSHVSDWLGDQPLLILDKDKLRTKYKIRPFKDTSQDDDFEDIEQYDEMEEVIDRDITNLNQYLIKVVLPYPDEVWEEYLKEKNIPYEYKNSLKERNRREIYKHRYQKTKDPFGLNAYAAELGRLREEFVLLDLENQYGIDLDLYDNGKHLTLSRILIPKEKRGQGIGSKVMNQITQYADKENKPIYLTPTKDFGASSVNRLEQFYKQFGFKKKDKSDFSTRETMVRIPLREDEEQDWKIYLDMDGVVADFEQRFKDLSGMAPSEFEAKYGKNAFWDFIDEGDNKIKFWVGIPPMEGASQLVNYVSKHDYVMLTAPSIKKQSRLGKALWIRNHVGKIFPTKPTVIFKAAKEKHKVKPSLTEKDILIDDKASTIDNWNAVGGTGILFTSAGQAISELKKLGL